MQEARPHIIPSIEEWPISKFSENRENFVLGLRRYTMEKVLQHKKYNIQELLQKSIFLEKKRSKREKWKVDPNDEVKFWTKMEKELHEINLKNSRETKDFLPVLEKIIHRYAEEIVGNFRPKTFRFARKFLTGLFRRLYCDAKFKRPHKIWGDVDDLLNKLKIYGPVDKVRTLFEKGVVVFVPTHFSNLDSILLGYKFDFKVGVPAFIYGAGLNLYNAELLAYFMNRLGTYRVDRRKKNLIYIETLKSMNTLSIIQGVNNLFFPGGTRSRSGKIESKIKLGLLNSTVEAQRYCLDNNIEQKIFLVPMVTRYPFVLDANNLISEHLKRQGQERYFHNKPDDSFFKMFRTFLSKIYTSEAISYLSFGEPMDIFGNKVDEAGNSMDAAGNLIQLKDYFEGIQDDADYIQRESVYTKRLGQKIIDEYKRANIIIPSHLVAYLAYKYIQRKQEEEDIFNLLLIEKKHFVIPKDLLLTQINFIKTALKEYPAANHDLKDSSHLILAFGIRYLGSYNNDRPLKYISEDEIGTESIKLLYYYHNQLSSEIIDKICSTKDFLQLYKSFN